MFNYSLQIEFSNPNINHISSKTKASNKLLTLFFPIKRVVSSFFKRQTKKYASVLSCCWYCFEYPIYLSFIAYSFMFMCSLNIIILNYIWNSFCYNVISIIVYPFINPHVLRLSLNKWLRENLSNKIYIKSWFIYLAYKIYCRCYSVSLFDIVALNVQYSLWGMRS